MKTKMKQHPRGHEEDVLALVMETYRLEAGFFGKSRISKNLDAWVKKRDAAATKAVPKRSHDVRGGGNRGQ